MPRTLGMCAWLRELPDQHACQKFWMYMLIWECYGHQRNFKLLQSIRYLAAGAMLGWGNLAHVPPKRPHVPTAA